MREYLHPDILRIYSLIVIKLQFSWLMPCIEIQTPACLLLFLCLLPGEENNSKFCDSKKLMWQQSYCLMKEQILIRQPGKFTLVFFVVVQRSTIHSDFARIFPEYCASCLDCHTFISWKIERCFTGLISQNIMKHTKWDFQKLKLFKITVLAVLFFLFLLTRHSCLGLQNISCQKKVTLHWQFCFLSEWISFVNWFECNLNGSSDAGLCLSWGSSVVTI